MDQHELEAHTNAIMESAYEALMLCFSGMTDTQRSDYMKRFKQRWCTECGKSTYACDCFALDDDDISKL